MNISVIGIGWVTKAGYGSVRLGVSHSLENGETVQAVAKRDIFSQPFKNFARLDRLSQITTSAVALTLRDSGMEYSQSMKQDIGIIGAGSRGSLESDIDYFRDYVENGRTLSRANLFIYTLPSSPLGEAAIHFGLVGPLMYVAAKEHALEAVMEIAAEMVSSGETDRMLAGLVSEEEALYFMLDRGNREGELCSLSDAESVLESGMDVSRMVWQFSLLKDRK